MTTSLEARLRDHRLAVDLVLAAVVGLLVSIPYLGYSPAAAATSLLLASALALRRVAPGAALVVGVTGALLQLLATPAPTVSIVVVPALIYSAARWGSPRQGQSGLLLGLAGAFLGPLRWALSVGSASAALIYFAMGVTGCAGVVVAAYLVGRRRRENQDNVRERRVSELERSRLMLAEQQQRAAVAAVDERNRIARDLHDIVAHSLSVIVVQAEGGKALATKRPEQGPLVLGTIAETGREALEEMRRMVGLLRSGAAGEPEQTSYLPAPGLEEIPELVRKTSEHAELSTFGEPPRVSQALGLTAYRIVQESLTNVLKHAGPAATARVTLAFTASSIEIEVTDDGPAGAAGDGLGHGLQGMQERVAIHGGTLSAGPRPGHGFTVRASLPLASDPTAPLPLRSEPTLELPVSVAPPGGRP